MNWQDFQKLIVLNKNYILWLFRFGYAGILFLIFLGAWAVFSGSDIRGAFNSLAKMAGQAALLLFCLVLAPGIALRFKLSHPLIGVAMFFRRQMGVTVFLLASFHGLILRLIPRIAFGLELVPLKTFELFGSLALFLMLPMWLTSNDWAMKKMGHWWKRTHRVIYLVAWLIFFHVAWQGGWKWASLVGLMGIIEVVSWAYFLTAKKQLERLN